MKLRRRQVLSAFMRLAPAPFFLTASFSTYVNGAEDKAVSPSVRRLAEAYLRQRPAEADRELLLRELGGSLPNAGSSSDLTESFRAQISADFAADRTIMLDGWMLSETECRLCALRLVA